MLSGIAHDVIVSRADPGDMRGERALHDPRGTNPGMKSLRFAPHRLARRKVSPSTGAAGIGCYGRPTMSAPAMLEQITPAHARSRPPGRGTSGGRGLRTPRTTRQRGRWPKRRSRKDLFGGIAGCNRAGRLLVRRADVCRGRKHGPPPESRLATRGRRTVALRGRSGGAQPSSANENRGGRVRALISARPPARARRPTLLRGPTDSGDLRGNAPRTVTREASRAVGEGSA